MFALERLFQPQAPWRVTKCKTLFLSTDWFARFLAEFIAFWAAHVLGPFASCHNQPEQRPWPWAALPKGL